MKRFVALAVIVAFVGVARADDKDKKDDKKDAKAGVTGTWKWEVEVQGQKREVTLKLKQDGDKVTGAMVGRNNMETKIENATLKDGELSFTVTRERDGNKFVSTYKAKVTGDTMKGTIESERDGQKNSREFEAKRTEK